MLPPSSPAITSQMLGLNDAIRKASDAGIEAVAKALGGGDLAAGSTMDTRLALKARMDAIVEDGGKTVQEREAALAAMAAAFRQAGLMR